MGFTQADLDRINEKIVDGEKRIEHESGSVTNRELDDLIRIRDKIRAELGKSGTDSRVVIPQHDKGL